MSTTLHIRNLNTRVTESELEDLFNRIGLVLSATIPVNARTGESEGVGIVSMTSPGAMAAIKKLNGSMFHELQLSVREADSEGGE